MIIIIIYLFRIKELLSLKFMRLLLVSLYFEKVVVVAQANKEEY